MAEIQNQIITMLAHEVFSLETNRRILVDHAFNNAKRVGETRKNVRFRAGTAQCRTSIPTAPEGPH